MRELAAPGAGSDTLFEIALEAAPAALLMVDASGVIRLVNRHAETLFGYDRSELLDHPVDMLLPASARMAHARHRADFATQPSSRPMGKGRVLFALRKDGQQVPVDVGLNPVPMSDGNAVLVSVVDVSERTRMVEALQRSEAKARAVFDLTFEFIGLLDTSGRVIEANHAAVSFAGVEAHAVIGQPFWETPWWRHSPEEQARVREAIARAAQGDFVRFETTHPSTGGEVRTIDFSLKPVRDDRGTVIWLIPEGRDITDLRNAERQRRTLEAQMGHSQNMEAIGTLAGGLAHNFNNVLAVILANLSLVQDDVGRDHPAADSLRQIRESVDHATNLVQQILAFSRPRRGVERRAVDLAAAIRADIKLIRAVIPAGIDMTVTESPVPPVLCDPHEIDQVLIGLCTNAWQAMEGDSGRIDVTIDAVELAPDAVGASALSPGSYVRIRIRDNGKGMDEATLARVFEPFFTTKPSGKGTGLGLTMAHRIVSDLGGTITATSEPGTGTTFEIQLPAVTPSAAGGHSPTAAPLSVRARGRGTTVLLVDDDETILEVQAKALARRGYRATPCGSAAAAMAVLSAPDAAIEVVVTDYAMPGTSGLELARALSASRPGLPVVLTSGNLDDSKREEAAAIGIAVILDKPFDIDALCGAVERAGASRRRRVEPGGN